MNDYELVNYLLRVRMKYERVIILDYFRMSNEKLIMDYDQY